MTKEARGRVAKMRARIRARHPDWSEDELNWRVEYVTRGFLQMVDVATELGEKSDVEIAVLLAKVWVDTSLFTPESGIIMEAAERLGLPKSWWEEEDEGEGEEKSEEGTA